MNLISKIDWFCFKIANLIVAFSFSLIIRHHLKILKNNAFLHHFYGLFRFPSKSIVYTFTCLHEMFSVFENFEVFKTFIFKNYIFQYRKHLLCIESKTLQLFLKSKFRIMLFDDSLNLLFYNFYQYCILEYHFSGS